MTQLKIENHNAVALLSRLRDATHNGSKRHRRTAFNGLKDALKGLGMVKAKDSIEALYEGVDSNGDHWFMAQLRAPPGEALELPRCPRCKAPYDGLCLECERLEQPRLEAKLKKALKMLDELFFAVSSIEPGLSPLVRQVIAKPMIEAALLLNNSDEGKSATTQSEQVQGRTERPDGSEVAPREGSKGPPEAATSAQSPPTPEAEGLKDYVHKPWCSIWGAVGFCNCG